MPPLEIRNDVVEPTHSNAFRVTSDYVSSSDHACNHEVCSWKSANKLVFEDPRYLIDEVGKVGDFKLCAAFDYDGCNIRNAHVTVGSGSYTAIGESYSVWAQAKTDTTQGSSGCTTCCEHSTCVTFIVTVDLDVLWGLSTTRYKFEAICCGSGWAGGLPL